MNLQDNVANLKGVGKKRLPLLAKLRIETMDDLVHFFPRRYEDRRQIVPIMAAPIGRDVLIGGSVVTKQMVGSPYSRKRLLKVLIEDNTGNVELLFFNGKYLESYFRPGEQMTFFGRISLNNGRRQMGAPGVSQAGRCEGRPGAAAGLSADRGADAGKPARLAAAGTRGDRTDYGMAAGGDGHAVSSVQPGLCDRAYTFSKGRTYSFGEPIPDDF